MRSGIAQIPTVRATTHRFSVAQVIRDAHAHVRQARGIQLGQPGGGQLCSVAPASNGPIYWGNVE